MYLDALIIAQGLKEGKADDFVIYPNPVKDQLKVKMNVQGGKPLYSVTNALGKEVMSGELAANEIIDMAALQNGVYFVTVNSGSESSTRKIVKN